MLVPAASTKPSSLYAKEEKGASYDMQDEGLRDPESYVYNFLSRPTLAIICHGKEIKNDK